MIVPLMLSGMLFGPLVVIPSEAEIWVLAYAIGVAIVQARTRALVLGIRKESADEPKDLRIS